LIGVMFQSGFSDVLASRNRDEFQHQVGVFTRRLGFDNFCAAVVIDHMPGEAEFITVSNSPRVDASGIADRKSARRDSLMQRCKRSGAPIIWGQPPAADQSRHKKRRPPSRFADSSGICVALHMPEGRHFLLGVERRETSSAEAAELSRIVADLQLFAAHAQDAALRILLPLPADPAAPALTPRELEAMRLAMEGKTSAELADLLGINERTVKLHLDNATQKLGCPNLHQALLKALRLGLLG
jgi:DNA-binding CsgD family transcriptional regulator